MAKRSGLNVDDVDMGAIQQGDSDVLARIMVRWHKPMRKFYSSMAYLAGSLECEDFLQELSIRIWQRAGSYRSGSFRGWVYCLARSIIIDSRRKDRLKLVEMTGGHDVTDTRFIDHMNDDSDLIAAKVHQYLYQRCGTDRGIAMGWLLSGECTIHEYAEFIGISENTARWWRCRIVEELKNRQEELIQSGVGCV
jgi:RNA polymerase sigma factor (sigma-70 family)